jgi:hypothetical protein
MSTTHTILVVPHLFHAFDLCHVHGNAECFDKHGFARQNIFANQLVAHNVHGVTRCTCTFNVECSGVSLVTWIQPAAEEGSTSSLEDGSRAHHNPTLLTPYYSTSSERSQGMCAFVRRSLNTNCMIHFALSGEVQLQYLILILMGYSFHCHHQLRNLSSALRHGHGWTHVLSPVKLFNCYVHPRALSRLPVGHPISVIERYLADGRHQV